MSIVRCIARAYAVEETGPEVAALVADSDGPFVSLTLDPHVTSSPGLIAGEGSVDIGICNIEAVWDT